MSILGALSTSVSGLTVQAYALENISGNIANASTTGFKRVDTSFIDMIPDQPAKHELAGSVSARSNMTTTIQGTLNTTGIATNVALSGDGFFVVAKNSGSLQTPAFSGERLYTRRGDFSQDASGYLVNGSGHYLAGTTYDPVSGGVVGSTNSPIQISGKALAAKSTTTVNYTGNLASIPKPATYSVSDPNSDLLQNTSTTGTFTTDPTVPGATVNGNDQALFLKETVPGGQVTVYDSTGTPANAVLRWGKVANADPAATPPAVDKWQLFYQTNSSATGTATAWQSAGSAVTFDANGQLTSASTVSLGTVTIDGKTIGPVTVDFGSGQLTQYGDPNGAVAANIDQNGFTSGTLTNVSIASDGSVNGNYSNGQVTRIAQLSIAQFAASDSLKRQNGGAYSATLESGSPNYGLNGSSLSGGSVEASNTDISDEFSKMIVTQQAYSANTKVITTAQQMLQDVINIIR